MDCYLKGITGWRMKMNTEYNLKGWILILGCSNVASCLTKKWFSTKHLNKTKFRCKTGDRGSASLSPKSRARACVSVCRWMCRRLGGLGNLCVRVHFFTLCSWETLSLDMFAKWFHMAHTNTAAWGYNITCRIRCFRVWHMPSGRTTDGWSLTSIAETNVFLCRVIFDQTEAVLKCLWCIMWCFTAVLGKKLTTLLTNNAHWNTSLVSQGITTIFNDSAPHDLCPKPTLSANAGGSVSFM